MLVQRTHGVVAIVARRDVVSIENRAHLVTTDVHRDRFVDPAANQILIGGSSPVVESSWDFNPPVTSACP